MDELTIVDVISILKPLCDSFMNEPTAKKAEEITQLVNKTSSTLVQRISANILFPITHHLKSNTLSKNKNLKLIEAVRAVIQKVRIENAKLFFEIYYCLRTQICQQKNTTELIETHEELKEVIMLCLRDLIKNCSISIIESFYTRQYAALLSHGIYLCIKIARLEKSASLRLAAIDAVLVLLQVHEEADSQDTVLRNQIGDVIMLYLPGIANGILEVALGSDIQNHKITMMAIRAWSRAIALVMQDMPEEDNSAVPSLDIDNIIKVEDPSDLEKIKHILENAKRTPEWYLAVSEKFKILFTELDNLTKHTHFKVRRELVEGISLLLLSCSRNLKPCFQILLEILITFSEDENSQVAISAREALQKIQNKCLEDKNMKTAVEVLEENLYDLLTKLPRIIRTSSESTQLVWLNRLAGYLKIFGKQRLPQILLSTAHLQKLLLSLVYIAELDSSDVSLLEDITFTNYEDISYYKISRSWKQYKFLYDSASIEKLNQIFKILGEFGDHRTLVDSILKMSLDFPKFKKELILILNAILEVPADSTVQMSICKQVIEHYTASDYWDLPIKVSGEITLQAAQNNVIQCCLLLEGFGIIANNLQEDYQYFLLKTLYLIIERAGSEHSLLRLTGLSTLEIVAKSQKLSNIGDLFRVNFDYISYNVTVKLRRVERNPGVLDVVGVVTNYSTMDFLPHLKDIMDDLLLQSSSNFQKRNAQSFLKVFYAFVICVKRLTSKESVQDNKEFFENLITGRLAETVVDNFFKFYSTKKDSKLFENCKESENDFWNNLQNNDVNPEENNMLDHNQDEKDVKVPYFVSMIRDIMKRCLHFLPSQDFTEASLAMSTLKEGSLILKEWENELLPIVHELWHPLVERFQDSNPLVINHAWQLLCCLAKVSQDFIRSRTLKQIMPALSNFLKKSCKESYKKDSGSTYKFTQIFKLQREILSQLGSVVRNLKLLEKETWSILNIAEPYLDCLQNQQLQDCCVNMYKEIATYNADIVWIKCVDIWNRHVEPVTPENNLNNWYSKITDCNVASSYRQNLQIILTYLHVKNEFL